MAVAPHSLAAESAVAVLRDGGNAVEAMVAAAATIAGVYPHMNGIGGGGEIRKGFRGGFEKLDRLIPRDIAALKNFFTHTQDQIEHKILPADRNGPAIADPNLL